MKRGHIEHVQVAGVAGDTLTLKSPGLVYGHPGQRNMTDEWDVDANGRKKFVPHVAHITRNVVFISDE